MTPERYLLMYIVLDGIINEPEWRQRNPNGFTNVCKMAGIPLDMARKLTSAEAEQAMVTLEKLHRGTLDKVDA